MHSYPNHPGHRVGAVETSRAAAETMVDAAKSRSALALATITQRGSGGATADEVADDQGWERYSSRPRVAELHKRGAIVDSGNRRIGASGRAQVVWVIPAYGPNRGDPVQLDWLAA